jgi:hypothetical protein
LLTALAVRKSIVDLVIPHAVIAGSFAHGPCKPIVIRLKGLGGPLPDFSAALRVALDQFQLQDSVDASGQGRCPWFDG